MNLPQRPRPYCETCSAHHWRAEPHRVVQPAVAQTAPRKPSRKRKPASERRRAYMREYQRKRREKAGGG